MSRRFLEWRNSVFINRDHLLVVTALEGVLVDPGAGTLCQAAAQALTALAQLRGVDVALLSSAPVTELASQCRDVPAAWLIGDSGRTVRDPVGKPATSRTHTLRNGSAPHGIREVVERLPRHTAVLLGVHERLDCSAIAATHVRSNGLALHVAPDGERGGGELADGIVRGRSAWIEFFERLHGAILLRGERAIEPHTSLRRMAGAN